MDRRRVFILGLFIGIGGMLGIVSGLVQWLPLAVLAPIIVYVAIDITTQAFQATPREHAGAMVLGFLLAYQFYIRRPDLPGKLATQQRPLYLFLLNKWYFDQLYDWVIIRPAKWLGSFLWKKGDGVVIDGTINGIAMGIIPFFTRLAGRAQSGYLFHYAFAMVLGIAALLPWEGCAGAEQRCQGTDTHPADHFAPAHTARHRIAILIHVHSGSRMLRRWHYSLMAEIRQKFQFDL